MTFNMFTLPPRYKTKSFIVTASTNVLKLDRQVFITDEGEKHTFMFPAPRYVNSPPTIMRLNKYTTQLATLLLNMRPHTKH
jgi:hypothetical protein